MPSHVPRLQFALRILASVISEVPPTWSFTGFKPLPVDPSVKSLPAPETARAPAPVQSGTLQPKPGYLRSSILYCLSSIFPSCSEELIKSNQIAGIHNSLPPAALILLSPDALLSSPNRYLAPGSGVQTSFSVGYQPFLRAPFNPIDQSRNEAIALLYIP